MLTLFTLPKAFTGHSDIIQRNAIQSWLRLQPACQVILCGNDPGVAQAAADYGLLHLPDVPVNEFGTPLLDGAFAMAQAAAQNALVCYLNADIILLSDFLTALQRVKFARFLLVGQRWNLDIDTALDFSASDWESSLRQRVQHEGVLYPPMGSDYFVFPRGSLGELPPFVVGRPGWDNWMIYHARQLHMPVIDSTRACMVVHQNHDYRHVKASYRENAYEGPEADHNLRIMGGNRTRFILADATHLLTRRGLQPAWDTAHLTRRVRPLAALHPALRPLADRVSAVSSRRKPENDGAAEQTQPGDPPRPGEPPRP
jgi:hypothetical protein